MTETYTHGHHDSVLRSHRWRTVENSAAYAVDHLTPGTTVLDVGCGPGTITADIAVRVAPGAVIGVDRAADVLVEATRHARDVGAENLTFAAQDVYSLPYDDGTFDVVHAHQTLQHLAEPVLALKEMRRVCRSGGVVVARESDYAGFTWYPRLPELDTWMGLYQSTARANGGEPDAGRRLLAWARAAGFTEVTPSASVWCFATPEDREYWGRMWAARILDSRMADQVVETGLGSREDLQKMSAAWQRWTEDPDGWISILHGEVVCRV
ncbi:methyltransferase domain-containing protein [Isoptericola jiangsuensis]|uniref:methyltransferase domain-containing protein n=1 Tax=Isoptericola jiangsuensis TaxID=548579 RepID=UPI003AAAE244